MGEDNTGEGMSEEAISGYGKVHALGHREIARLFDAPVVVEEKIDGSQFSFGLFDGQVHCRSRGRALSDERCDKMFLEGLAVAKSLAGQLVPGWTYRGEYLRRPSHNVLAYSRIPKNHVILFDVEREYGSLLNHVERATEAERLGLESVPVLFAGGLGSVEDIAELMETVSVLGGQKIEGLVFKRDGMKGKHVSERFKEMHRTSYKSKDPKESITSAVANTFRTEARWEKAIQHLRDDGKLTNEPRDIGPLMREMQSDLLTECEDLIKEQLFQLAKKEIVSIVSRGFPEFYKARLAASQFEGE